MLGFDDHDVLKRKILNPHQRQLLEDKFRLQEKIAQMNQHNEDILSYRKPISISQDVDLLDKHDSFYHTTKSLLVLFQLTGVMPIMRSPKGMLMLKYNYVLVT